VNNCRSRLLAVAVCLALCAGVAVAEEGRETARYRELVSSEAAFASAIAAHRRGDLDAAEHGYRKAISGDPAFVEAMVNLARVHIARHELSSAVMWLDRAEAQRPEYPGIDAARGLAALAAGETSAAIDDLSRARSRAPKDVEVLTNLAAALLEQDANREAVDVLEDVLRLDPHRPDTWFNLGLAYDRMGDTPRAEYHYQRYLGLAQTSDPQRARVMERIEVLANAGAQRSRSNSSSPATSTRTVATGGVRQ